MRIHRNTYNPSQSISKPVQEMKSSRIFMERLIAHFVQYSSPFTKYLVLEGQLDTRLFLHLMFRLSYIFNISYNPKSL